MNQDCYKTIYKGETYKWCLTVLRKNKSLTVNYKIQYATDSINNKIS